MMSHSVSSLLAGVALPCSYPPVPGQMTEAGTSGLSGTWYGSFAHPGADYTSPSKADLTLQVARRLVVYLQVGDSGGKHGHHRHPGKPDRPQRLVGDTSHSRALR